MTREPFLVCLLILLVSLGSAAPAWSASSQEREIESLVNQAAALIEQEGPSALAQFSQPGGRWLGGPHALFIFDEQGNELVNPTFPELVGKNLWDHRDSSGRYTAREELALVKAQGSGWLDGAWAKPGHGPEAKTRNFVKGARMGPTLVVVGSWYYVD